MFHAPPALAVARTEHEAVAGAAMPSALTASFQAALLAGAGFGLAGALAALVLVRRAAPLRRASRTGARGVSPGGA